MRRLAKKIEFELTDSFESALDFIKSLDRVPFHIKREAAEKAARVAFEHLKETK